MGLSLERLHEIEEELRVEKLKYAPLRRRWQRAGAFKTRDRIQKQIDTLTERVKAVERKLIDSWGD